MLETFGAGQGAVALGEMEFYSEANGNPDSRMFAYENTETYTHGVLEWPPLTDVGTIGEISSLGLGLIADSNHFTLDIYVHTGHAGMRLKNLTVKLGWSVPRLYGNLGAVNDLFTCTDPNIYGVRQYDCVVDSSRLDETVHQTRLLVFKLELRFSFLWPNPDTLYKDTVTQQLVSMYNDQGESMIVGPAHGPVNDRTGVRKYAGDLYMVRDPQGMPRYRPQPPLGGCADGTGEAYTATPLFDGTAQLAANTDWPDQGATWRETIWGTKVPDASTCTVPNNAVPADAEPSIYGNHTSAHGDGVFVRFCLPAELQCYKMRAPAPESEYPKGWWLGRWRIYEDDGDGHPLTVSAPGEDVSAAYKEEYVEPHVQDQITQGGYYSGALTRGYNDSFHGKTDADGYESWQCYTFAAAMSPSPPPPSPPPEVCYWMHFEATYNSGMYDVNLGEIELYYDFSGSDESRFAPTSVGPTYTYGRRPWPPRTDAGLIFEIQPNGLGALKPGDRFDVDMRFHTGTYSGHRLKSTAYIINYNARLVRPICENKVCGDIADVFKGDSEASYYCIPLVRHNYYRATMTGQLNLEAPAQPRQRFTFDVFGHFGTWHVEHYIQSWEFELSWRSDRLIYESATFVSYWNVTHELVDDGAGLTTLIATTISLDENTPVSVLHGRRYSPGLLLATVTFEVDATLPTGNYSETIQQLKINSMIGSFGMSMLGPNDGSLEGTLPAGEIKLGYIWDLRSSKHYSGELLVNADPVLPGTPPVEDVLQEVGMVITLQTTAELIPGQTFQVTAHAKTGDNDPNSGIFLNNWELMFYYDVRDVEYVAFTCTTLYAYCAANDDGNGYVTITGGNPADYTQASKQSALYIGSATFRIRVLAAPSINSLAFAGIIKKMETVIGDDLRSLPPGTQTLAIAQDLRFFEDGFINRTYGEITIIRAPGKQVTSPDVLDSAGMVVSLHETQGTEHQNTVMINVYAHTGTDVSVGLSRWSYKFRFDSTVLQFAEAEYGVRYSPVNATLDADGSAITVHSDVASASSYNSVRDQRAMWLSSFQFTVVQDTPGTYYNAFSATVLEMIGTDAQSLLPNGEQPAVVQDLRRLEGVTQGSISVASTVDECGIILSLGSALILNAEELAYLRSQTNQLIIRHTFEVLDHDISGPVHGVFWDMRSSALVNEMTMSLFSGRDPTQPDITVRDFRGGHHELDASLWLEPAGSNVTDPYPVPAWTGYDTRVNEFAGLPYDHNYLFDGCSVQDSKMPCADPSVANYSHGENWRESQWGGNLTGGVAASTEYSAHGEGVDVRFCAVYPIECYKMRSTTSGGKGAMVEQWSLHEDHAGVMGEEIKREHAWYRPEKGEYYDASALPQYSNGHCFSIMPNPPPMPPPSPPPPPPMSPPAPPVRCQWIHFLETFGHHQQIGLQEMVLFADEAGTEHIPHTEVEASSLKTVTSEDGLTGCRYGNQAFRTDALFSGHETNCPEANCTGDGAVHVMINEPCRLDDSCPLAKLPGHLGGWGYCARFSDMMFKDERWGYKPGWTEANPLELDADDCTSDNYTSACNSYGQPLDGTRASKNTCDDRYCPGKTINHQSSQNCFGAAVRFCLRVDSQYKTVASYRLISGWKSMSTWPKRWGIREDDGANGANMPGTWRTEHTLPNTDIPENCQNYPEIYPTAFAPAFVNTGRPPPSPPFDTGSEVQTVPSVGEGLIVRVPDVPVKADSTFRARFELDNGFQTRVDKYWAYAQIGAVHQYAVGFCYRTDLLEYADRIDNPRGAGGCTAVTGPHQGLAGRGMCPNGDYTFMTCNNDGTGTPADDGAGEQVDQDRHSDGFGLYLFDVEFNFKPGVADGNYTDVVIAWLYHWKDARDNVYNQSTILNGDLNDARAMRAASTDLAGKTDAQLDTNAVVAWSNDYRAYRTVGGAALQVGTAPVVVKPSCNTSSVTLDGTAPARLVIDVSTLVEQSSTDVTINVDVYLNVQPSTTAEAGTYYSDVAAMDFSFFFDDDLVEPILGVPSNDDPSLYVCAGDPMCMQGADGCRYTSPEAAAPIYGFHEIENTVYNDRNPGTFPPFYTVGAPTGAGMRQVLVALQSAYGCSHSSTRLPIAGLHLTTLQFRVKMQDGALPNVDRRVPIGTYERAFAAGRIHKMYNLYAQSTLADISPTGDATAPFDPDHYPFNYYCDDRSAQPTQPYARLRVVAPPSGSRRLQQRRALAYVGDYIRPNVAPTGEKRLPPTGRAKVIADFVAAVRAMREPLLGAFFSPPPPPAPAQPLIDFFAIGPGDACSEYRAYEPTRSQCALIANSTDKVFEVYDHPTGELHDESGCMSWTTHHAYAVEYIVNDARVDCPRRAEVTCYCVFAN